MATDAERNRAFRKERAKRSRALPRIQRETDAEIGRLLRRTERDLRAQLAGDASDFTRFLNPQLRRSVRSTLETLGAQAGETLSGGAGQAWDAGVALVDEPINAGLALETPGVRIAADLASVDVRQLRAMRTFLTDKMAGVSVQAVNRVNTQLGLVATGVQTPGDAVGQVARILKSTRGRAVTIVRTELGRAYSTAAQERQAIAQRAPAGAEEAVAALGQAAFAHRARCGRRADPRGRRGVQRRRRRAHVPARPGSTRGRDHQLRLPVAAAHGELGGEWRARQSQAGARSPTTRSRRSPCAPSSAPRAASPWRSASAPATTVRWSFGAPIRSPGMRFRGRSAPGCSGARRDPV